MINRLDVNNGKDSASFFIHVDKRTDLHIFSDLEGRENVFFLMNRIQVERLGFSMTQALLSLLECGANSDCDRLVFLAGSNYPAVGNQEIFRQLDNDTEFLKAYKVTGSAQENKVCEYYFHDIMFSSPFLTLWTRRFLRKLMFWCKKKPWVIYQGQQLPVYYGSAWFSVTKSAADFICKEADLEPFKKYFKYSHCSCELFFHTILFNLRPEKCLPNPENSFVLADLAPINFHIYGEKRALFLDIEHYDVLKQSKRLFWGKAQTGKSDRLLERLDRECANSNSEALL